MPPVVEATRLVTYYSEVKKDIIAGDDGRIEGKTLTAPAEGVLIHGLFLMRLKK